MNASASKIALLSELTKALLPLPGRTWVRPRLSGHLLAAVFVLLTLSAAHTATAQPPTLTIGVLAYRGEQHALNRWQATADYLSKAIPGWEFRIEPLVLEGVAEALKQDRIDFLFTNPGNYVSSADRFELAPIATLRTDLPGRRQTGNRFGGVIFCRSDAKDIHAIGDLRGKTLAAVSPDAFGGFLVAAGTLLSQEVDPYEDIETLRFLGLPQDRIVQAVLSGDADAGFVRTGVIEAMAAEGSLDPDAIRVLNAQSVGGFDYLLSTELFPEWIFAATRLTPSGVRNTVAVALLEMGPDHEAARQGGYAGWTTPMNNRAVRRLFATVERARSEGATPTLDQLLAFALPAVALLLGALIWRTYRTPIPVLPAPSAPRPQPNESIRLSSYRLTPREEQVLDRILEGETNKEIALGLGISPKTVEFHRTHIMQKTKASSVAQLVQIVLGTPEKAQKPRAT